MARLTPGYQFTTGEAVTPAKMHALVDSAFLVGVVKADMAATISPVYRTTPAAPVNGDVRVGSDGRLEFYIGAAWVTQEADAVAITLTNKSGVDLLRGHVVVPSKAVADAFKLSSVVRTPDVLGVLAADIANNASGPVYLRGLVQAYVLSQSGFSLPAGTLLRGPDSSFLVDRQFIDGVDIKSDFCATLLQASSNGLSWVRFGK